MPRWTPRTDIEFRRTVGPLHPVGKRGSGVVPKSDKTKADVIREAFDAWQAVEYDEPSRYGVSGAIARKYVADYLGREPRDADEAENTVKTIQRGFRKLLTKQRS